MSKPATSSEYEFALIVEGVADISDAVVDALFDAGCDDATISLRHGLLSIEFSRLAPSLQDAIYSASANIRAALPEARILRVDAED